MSEKVWSCKIGTAFDDEVPYGGDGPMRSAVEAAFEKLIGRSPVACFSGWGAKFEGRELAVIENRAPRFKRTDTELLDWMVTDHPYLVRARAIAMERSHVSIEEHAQQIASAMEEASASYHPTERFWLTLTRLEEENAALRARIEAGCEAVANMGDISSGGKERARVLRILRGES